MSNGRQIVIVGAGGRLGAALLREYRSTHEVIGFSHAQLDLSAREEMCGRLGELEFELLINCAAQTNVDRCETERAEAFEINAEAPRRLAEICAQKNARLIHVSTDYVFDGETTEPYREDDAANPISVYGESKLEGERRVLAISADNLVVRVSWVFGPDRPSFIDWIVQEAREKDEVAAVADKYSTPTYTLDLAEMLRPLLWSRRAPAPEDPSDGSPTGPGAGRLQREMLGGIIHISNRGQCSWREYGQWALDCCRAEGVQLRAQTVDAVSLSEMKQFVARRPPSSALATEKYERVTGRKPRAWQDAVRAYVREHIARAG